MPERWIAGQARDVFAGENSTSGGSSETDMKLWQVMPTGSPRLIAVTTVIPVAKRPSTSRNLRAAWACSSVSTWIVSPGRSSKSKSPRNDSISSRLGQVSLASGRIPSGISSPSGTSLSGICGHETRVCHLFPTLKSWPQ